MFGSVLSGAQTTMHDWRMFRQLLRTLLFWAVLVTIISGLWSGWHIWQERPQQVKAAALIPAFKDTADPFWTTAAHQLFASGAAALWKGNEGGVLELVHLLLRTNLKELATRMQGFVEQSIIDPEDPKTALSVRANLSTALKPLVHMPPVRRPFSIRNWVESADDSFLFLSSDSISHESRKALIEAEREYGVVEHERDRCTEPEVATIETGKDQTRDLDVGI